MFCQNDLQTICVCVNSGVKLWWRDTVHILFFISFAYCGTNHHSNAMFVLSYCDIHKHIILWIIHQCFSLSSKFPIKMTFLYFINLLEHPVKVCGCRALNLRSGNHGYFLDMSSLDLIRLDESYFKLCPASEKYIAFKIGQSLLGLSSLERIE